MMSSKSYFGIAVQRSPQLSQTSAKQEADKLPELHPVDHFLSRSVDTSDWGEVETVSSPLRRSVEVASQSVSAASGRRANAPSVQQSHAEIQPGTVESAMSSELPPPSEIERSVSTPPGLNVSGDSKVKVSTHTPPGTPVSAQSIRSSAPRKTPPPIVSDSKDTQASGKRQDLLPAQRVSATAQDASQTSENAIQYDDTKLLPTIPPEQLSNVNSQGSGSTAQVEKAQKSVPSKLFPHRIATVEGDETRIVPQPGPHQEASPAFPGVLAPLEIPRATPSSRTESPKLTIGRIEVEVVKPPSQPERVVVSKKPASGTLSRDLFDSIGLAQR